MCWYMPIIPLMRLSQENCSEFKASLGYILSDYLKLHSKIFPWSC